MKGRLELIGDWWYVRYTTYDGGGSLDYWYIRILWI